MFNQMMNSTNPVMWSWADAHPYLFTMIHILEPSLALVLLVAGANVAAKIMRAMKGGRY